MKHPIIAGLIGFAIFLLAIVFLVAQGTLEKTLVQQPEEIISVTMIERSASTTDYEFEVSYPYDVRDIEGLIARDVESFISGTMNEWQQNSPLIDEKGEPLPWKNQLWVTSDETNASVFDIRCHTIGKEQFSGGAHPNGAVATYCFDKDSKRLTLSSLFTDQNAGLQFMASSTKTKLVELMKENFEDDSWMFEEGFAPSRENFSTFIVTDEGLVVTFQSYQVGPYVIGRPQVTWTWQELESFLNPPFLAE